MTATLPALSLGEKFPSKGEALSTQFVSLTIDGQRFGILVLDVEDVIEPTNITPIPKAPPEVRGLINLRGRIVTVIDMRVRLGLAKKDDDEIGRSVVVTHDDQLYSLAVDAVGDVIVLENRLYEPNPVNLSPAWQEVSAGVYRLESELMIVLEVDKILKF
ncbi:MAG: chemotaxis protein CheW [Rickettsiales bacterium]|nr:chemotaxis protein CheW [Rickettsiales bacterium]